jgi:hypothetical protein
MNKKLFSMFLSFILILSMVNIDAVFNQSYARSDDKQIGEILVKNNETPYTEDLRVGGDIYSKHYKNNDGTYTAELGLAPLYYEENNEFKEINTQIVKGDFDEYENAVLENLYKVYFNEFNSIEDDILTKVVIKNSEGIERIIYYKMFNTVPTDSTVDNNIYRYKNIFNDVDLEYIVTNNGLKENFIVNKPIDKYEFTIGVDYDKSLKLIYKNEKYYFFDKETGEYLWELAKPFAEDANHDRTDNVTLKYAKQFYNQKEYECFTVQIEDKEFINNAKFPIVIDPTTLPSIVTSADSYVCSDTTGSNYGTSNILRFGERDYSPEDIKYSTYLKFPMNSIPAGAKLLSAKLALTNAVTYDPDKHGNIFIYRSTSDWTESGISYGNTPTYDAVVYKVLVFNNRSLNQENQVDVTEIVRKWVDENEPNYGFALPSKSWGTGSNAMSVHSKEAINISYRPKLIISYSLPPELSNTITNNQVFSHYDTQYIPTVNVKDNDNETITCKYYIDSETTPRDTKSIVNTSTLQTVSFSPLNMSTLTEGNHTIKFEASDGYTTSILAVNIRVDKTPPQINSLLLNSSSASITATCTANDTIAGLDLNPYRYTVETATSWIKLNPYIKSGLTPNRIYNVKLEVKDAAGNIASTTNSIFTKAAIPSLTISSITSNSLSVITSDNNPSETQYQISVNNGTQYVTPEGKLNSTPVWITFYNKNITVAGLDSSSTYTFTAKAKNGINDESNWSTPISGTTLIKPPSAPLNVTATATSNSINVKWDVAATSTGYDIELDGIINDNSTSTSYTHTNLVPSTQHSYRVRGKNAGGVGEWSATINKYTEQVDPNVPVNIDAAATNTSVIVTWKPILGTTAYDIEVDGVIVNNSSSTNYVHTGLIPGTRHSYRVRSINSAGKSAWSHEIVIFTQIEAPPVPNNIDIQEYAGQITLTWEEVQGATYEIEVDGNIRDNGTSESFVHTGLTGGSEHKYRVRARISGSTSDWSAIQTAVVPIEAFGTPRDIKASTTDSTIALSWSPVKDAIRYEVEVDGIVLDNGTETSCIFSSLNPSTLYSYRVKAIGTNQESDWSEVIFVDTFALPTPKNVQTFASGDNITIVWDEVQGSESYDIEIDGEATGGINNNSYAHEEIVPNTQYSYRVRAVNTDGTSNWSPIITESIQIAAQDIPDGIIAKSTTDSIYIMWSPMDEAESYEIEIDGTTIESISETWYLHDGLDSFSQHSYRIRGIMNGDQGKWSNLTIVKTLPDTPLPPTNIITSSTMSSILITWDKVNNADEYEIEIDGVIVNVGLNSKYLHSDLLPDSTHVYRVRVRNSISQSLWSEPISVKTKSSVNSYNLQLTNGQVFNLTITANEILNPIKHTYTITYNPEELELIDLCGISSRIDLDTGNIIGTDIQIIQVSEGTIVFKKLGDLTGQAWTGYINSIKFRSKKDGESQIIYSIQ